MHERLSGEARLQRAFEEAAADLDLDLEAEDAPLRSIGLAAGKGAPTPIVELDLTPAGKGDDAKIEDLLTTWENLLPAEQLEHYREYALDPYVGLGDWLVEMGNESLTAWINGEDLKQALAERPPLSQRRVALSEMRIVYVGDAKAAVTYRARESYEGYPQTYSGNVGAFLVHVDAGWRIACYTKASSVWY